jgi:predicted O-methyltransferase YrrM
VARPPESFADVEQRMARVLDGIDGWLQPAEAAVLYQEARLAAERSDRVCLVELGSWQGRSTLAISIGLRDGGGRGALYAIGPHDYSDEGEQSFHALQRNVERAGVSDQVHVVRAIATEAASDFEPGVVDGLYVDGDHDLEAVRADLAAWQAKLRPGAFVGFNGLFGRGSRRALQQIFLASASPYRCPRWMANTMFFEFRPNRAEKPRERLARYRARAFLVLFGSYLGAYNRLLDLPRIPARIRVMAVWTHTHLVFPVARRVLDLAG